MKLQLIRNATMKIEYGGKTFLTDPMLSPKGAIRSFAGIAENPTVDLPVPVDEILQGVDAVIVSHNHPDHLDEPAVAGLNKTMPVFCQPRDDSFLVENGFRQVFPISSKHTWEGIDFSRTGGRHGQGEIGKLMGEVSGFVLQASGEPTLYWAGDSIWCDEVKEAIEHFSPDVIITHSGGATLPGHDPIIMTGEETISLSKAAPDARVVAVHLEALDHCTVTREGLRKMRDEASIPDSRLVIPEDGETVNL